MVLNVEIFNGHIRQVKDLSLTAETLEQLLSDYKYSGEGRIRDPAVEDLQFPPIALTFYSVLYETGLPPTDMALVEAYLAQEDYFAYLPGEKVSVTYGGRTTSVSLDGLIARILRTYPSLIRDLHFFLLARDCGHFSAVRYSADADFAQGVDIKVQYNGAWYNVGLCLSSKRSLFYKARKAFRHKPIDIIYIELEQKDAKIVGDYMLYSEQHINQLLKQINRKKH